MSTIKDVPIANIIPNPRNDELFGTPFPQEEAAFRQSILEHGIQIPLRVAEHPPDRFDLIAGHRRLEAATALTLTTAADTGIGLLLATPLRGPPLSS